MQNSIFHHSGPREQEQWILALLYRHKSSQLEIAHLELDDSLSSLCFSDFFNWTQLLSHEDKFVDIVSNCKNNFYVDCFDDSLVYTQHVSVNIWWIHDLDKHLKSHTLNTVHLQALCVLLCYLLIYLLFCLMVLNICDSYLSFHFHHVLDKKSSVADPLFQERWNILKFS